jgi:hypothetical protein
MCSRDFGVSYLPKITSADLSARVNIPSFPAMLPSASGRCPGCNIDFKGGKGLSLHLKLTSDEPCRAIFLAAENRGTAALPAFLRQEPSAVDDNTEKFGDLSDHGLPRGASTFDGDFFGENYTSEELGFDPGDDDEEGTPDSESDDDEDPSARDHEDASRAGLEDGYEAPRPSAAPDSDSAMPDAVPVTAPAPTREARKAAEDRFHRKPFIEKYPGASAGKPASSFMSETSEQVYKSSLADSAATNPYAPFTSKMDWEIAKWAKLRGSGSTAFTDLLHIDGVRAATILK